MIYAITTPPCLLDYSSIITHMATVRQSDTQWCERPPGKRASCSIHDNANPTSSWAASRLSRRWCCPPHRPGRGGSCCRINSPYLWCISLSLVHCINLAYLCQISYLIWYNVKSGNSLFMQRKSWNYPRKLGKFQLFGFKLMNSLSSSHLLCLFF